MADDDPFADLGETLADDADDSDTPDGSTDPPADDPATDGPTDGGRSDGDSTADDTGRGDGENVATPDPTTDAAFSYGDADQRPFYARPTTIEEFDSWLNYELERDLHERGFQNIVVREMTDALLRTVVEEDLLDEVAERFERAREDAASDRQRS